MVGCISLLILKRAIFAERYLAVVGALTSEADYVFVPEDPPPVDWQKKLCDKLEQASPPMQSKEFDFGLVKGLVYA